MDAWTETCGPYPGEKYDPHPFHPEVKTFRGGSENRAASFHARRFPGTGGGKAEQFAWPCEVTPVARPSHRCAGCV